MDTSTHQVIQSEKNIRINIGTFLYHILEYVVDEFQTWVQNRYGKGMLVRLHVGSLYFVHLEAKIGGISDF